MDKTIQHFVEQRLVLVRAVLQFFLGAIVLLLSTFVVAMGRDVSNATCRALLELYSSI